MRERYYNLVGQIQNTPDLHIDRRLWIIILAMKQPQYIVKRYPQTSTNDPSVLVWGAIMGRTAHLAFE